ncbi:MULTISPECIES: TIGR02677 family protein [unclassified Leifsonia]|uniref:TIGR02677 family protein n=1 Tax=unclassified Leifsonia TaxID=2663824 RepID=UPI0008A75857|nr:MULTISPECIES: TIGR02677 family protein [unclassified Leifsonia]SEI10157.1 TIGR02677 family protein [Leifsonia sp. CL154]SFL86553.1 TIGR02677 family protein [Leifsonia sp. CL147]
MSPDSASGAFGVFSHLNAPNAELYRRVLGAFVASKERFHLHLRPDDVLAQLRRSAEGDDVVPTIEATTAALESLVEWGNLIATPDTGRVVQVEDFYSKRQLFQLSRAGDAAELALQRFDEALGRRGSLQTVALEDIAATLGQFLGLIGADELDVALIQTSLTALTTRFTELAENASAFMGSLQRTIDLTDTDEDAFVAYKSRLVEYLERFIRDLTVRGPQIASMLHDADPDLVERALRALADRDSFADAPVLDDEEVAQQSDRYFSVWMNRWEGLNGWFLSDGRRDSQAKLLRMAALAAIPTLLSAVQAVHARRSGRSDRSTDYLRLAVWFQEADNDEDRHRLARAAFGLYSARHLTVDSETWQRWNEDQSLAGARWADAPPVEISPQLRRTGSYERKGRPNQVVDRSAERAMLALRVRQEAEQIARARRRLATRGEVRLSALAGLDRTSFGLFLSLLGDALVAKRPGERTVSTASSDGMMHIELTQLDSDAMVALETASGTLWGPDHRVRITDLSQGAGEQLGSTAVERAS